MPRNFEDILEKVITQLEKKGLLKGVDLQDKEAFIKQLTGRLDGKINVADLESDQALQKMLGLMVISLAIENKFPQHKMNFEKFFNEQKKDDNGLKETKKELKEELKKLMLAMNELADRPELKLDSNKIDEYAEKWSEKVIDDFKKTENKFKVGENELLTDSVAELYLRTLNGGDNPTIAGEINYPINGPILGNLIGIPTQSVQSTAKETRSFMGDLGSYNSDKEGNTEGSALLAAVSQGIEAASTAPRPSFGIQK